MSLWSYLGLFVLVVVAHVETSPTDVKGIIGGMDCMVGAYEMARKYIPPTMTGQKDQGCGDQKPPVPPAPQPCSGGQTPSPGNNGSGMSGGGLTGSMPQGSGSSMTGQSQGQQQQGGGERSQQQQQQQQKVGGGSQQQQQQQQESKMTGATPCQK